MTRKQLKNQLKRIVRKTATKKQKFNSEMRKNL